MSSAKEEGDEAAPAQVETTGPCWRATYLTEGLMLLTLPEPARQGRAPLGPAELPLSPGESAVVRLAVLGLSNPEIAKSRGCSPRTVANHLASAYRKLGVSGRRALRAYWLGHGEHLAVSLTKEEGP